MHKKGINRRDFLKVSGIAAGTVLVGAACGKLPTPTEHPTLEVISTHTPVPSGGAGTDGWTGVVRARAGAVISNARVTLISADGAFFRETRSDQNGQYQIPDAPAGTFTLGASAPSYEYQELPSAAGGMDFTLGADVHPGRWSVIGDTEPEEFGGTNSGVLMPTGKIIYCHDTVRPIVFDPLTGNKERPKSSPSIQGCHMVSYLPDGRIFYVGGGGVDEGRNFNNIAVRTVKAFDPDTLSWEVLPELTEKRWYPGLTPLADGRYLVFGGGGQPERIRIETCEIFDPRTRTWTPTGSMTATGGFGPNALLLIGEVLVGWFPPQLYNVTSGQWRNTGMFKQPLRNQKRSELPNNPDHPDFRVILLDDGRVAAIGTRRTAGTSMVENYDPVTGEWVLGTSPQVLRSMPEVLRLPTGKILVAAGKNESGIHGNNDFTNEFGYTKLVDLYDPQTGIWHEMSRMKNAREYHAITLLLPDGRVAVTAGPAQPGLQPPPTPTKNVEALAPPYLFPRPPPRS